MNNAAVCKTSNLVPVPCTGMTPLFSSQMQPWAEQHCFERGIEGYCLDAPLYVPTGQTKRVSGRSSNGRAYAQALSQRREA